MKEIKAIIQPHMVGRVVHALHELPHFPGLTLIDAHGQGRGRGAGGSFVLSQDNLFFHPKKMIEIAASDEVVESIIETIRKAAHTGMKGDGIIVVTEISQTVRIGSGEAQSEAL